MCKYMYHDHQTFQWNAHLMVLIQITQNLFPLKVSCCYLLTFTDKTIKYYISKIVLLFYLQTFINIMPLF